MTRHGNISVYEPMEPLRLNTFVRLVVEIVFGRMGALKTTAVSVSEGNNKVNFFLRFFFTTKNWWLIITDEKSQFEHFQSLLVS